MKLNVDDTVKFIETYQHIMEEKPIYRWGVLYSGGKKTTYNDIFVYSPLI